MQQRSIQQHDFQNPYVRFIYAIKSPETRKRYPKRFKAFLDYVEIPGEEIEEILINFYDRAKQDIHWLQDSLIHFILFQKERVTNGEISQLFQTITNQSSFSAI